MSAFPLHAKDLTPDWAGFCRVWVYIGAHCATYGQPPHYRKTARFLASGGFAGAAFSAAKGPRR